MDSKMLRVNENLKLYVCEKTEDYGRFEVTDLARGFANTLGNALRRVLLSSIEGTAVTIIKKIEIDDEPILHEFTSLDGVRESVPELIFNLKKVIFDLDEDIYPEREAVIDINFDQEGNCYAKDIKLPTGVTIINPDQYLFQVADSTRKVYIQIQVEIGHGYVSAEDNKFKNCTDRKDAYVLNTIYVDTDFSPVRKVSYESVVTKNDKDSCDKLRLEIWTNGSVDPYDALKDAAKVLINDIAIFLDSENFIIQKPKIEDVVQIEEQKDESHGDIFLKDLEISVRSKNCLENTPIKTLRDLASHSAQELLEIKNFGQKSLVEVRNLLAEYGMKLKGE